MTVPEYGVPDYVRMARHEWDLSDDGHEVIELGVTNETDTDLRLAPDGAGGVEFVPGGGVDPDDFVKVIEGGQDTIRAHGSAGSTETLDPTDGNVHTLTLTADCTITLNAPTGSGAATLEVYALQDGTGGWDITWPGSVVWPGGTPPVPDTTLSTLTRYLLETLDGGTTWYGVMVGGGGTGVTYGTPAIVLGTVAAAGSTDEAIRRDSTIVAFDATAPTTQAFSDAAATGSAAVAARRDHKHGMPAASGTSATDASIWRPLMDGAGAVITDGTGQAVMAYGPA